MSNNIIENDVSFKASEDSKIDKVQDDNEIESNEPLFEITEVKDSESGSGLIQCCIR